MYLDPVIAAEAVQALEAPVLIDCRPEEPAYLASHLEGAHHAQLERDLSAPVSDPSRGGRHPLPAPATFAQTLGRWGVVPGAHVVLYDDQGGANAAARLWWMLRAFGHEQVQVVDGGLAALREAGLRLRSGPERPSDAPPYPGQQFGWPRATLDEVERARRDPSRRVFDVRAAFRYRGESEPIDPRAGHIPGALNVPLSENLEAGRFKSAEALRALYLRELGGSTPADAIVHCGSGVTACHTLLALERAGLPGAKLYVGSWSEWCRRPELPRAPTSAA